MARKVRRAAAAPRLEVLETRALLSAGAGPSVSAAWVPGAAVDPSAAVLMKFAAGTAGAVEQADLAAVGGRVVTSYPDGPSLVALPPWADRSADLAVLKGEPGVAYAEADATFHASGVHASGGPITPNNPGYPQEWGLAMIDGPSAWGVTTGTPGTIVAVLDTGLDLNNRAFAGRIWTNPSAGSDGYTGDVHGWNFLDGNNNLVDQNGHGTHVTGILAAAGNNGVGIAGVDWNTRIMPLKVLDAQGNGSTDASINAVYFAVNHGAKVINASWGGDSFSQGMLDALNYAGAHGVVFVTAAGNETSNNDSTTTYPASYHASNELVVAAVDRDGKLADFSNWGAATVDLAAPGVGIYSTIPGGFDTYSGTSMSTPFVSGTVALLAGLNPGLNAVQLVNRVRATVKPDPALNGLMVSPGVVDAYYALVNYVTQGRTVVKTATGPKLVAGSTPLEDVEAAVLVTDAVYNHDGGTVPGYVAGTYRAVLGRDASPDEITYQTNALQNGTSRFTLVRNLQNSQEGRRTRVARWYVDDLYASQTVDQLKSDPGVAAWADRLGAGWSDADVLSAMVSIDARYYGLGGTDAQFVSALYYEFLSRDPEPGGVPYHVSEMVFGASRTDVARHFLASPEGHNVTLARLYRDDLGAAGSDTQLEQDAGVRYWAGFLGGD